MESLIINPLLSTRVFEIENEVKNIQVAAPIKKGHLKIQSYLLENQITYSLHQC